MAGLTLPLGVKAEQAPFGVVGSHVAAWKSKDPEVCAGGPAGTGKTRTFLEKMHALAEKYPGFQGAILRKTRESLTNTILVQFERKVLPATSTIRLHDRLQRYRYPNGSFIAVGGLDKTSRIMGGEYDVVYISEVNELTEAEYEDVSTRLRVGVMPYKQLLSDCNPQSKAHWVYRRMLAKKLKLVSSTHDDNPAVTRDYLKRLDNLTGVRYKRLRLGLWVAAEGQIWEMWDEGLHRRLRFPIPRDWPRIWVADFGFTHPFCYDQQTEILTRTGWRRFADLAPGAEVGTVDPATKQFAWQTPTQRLQYHHRGEMVATAECATGTDFCVTPDHRMVVEDRRTGKWRKVRADELGSSSSIPIGWEAPDDCAEALYAIPQRGDVRRRRLDGVSHRAFARFLGLFYAEGSLHAAKRGKYVRLTQKNRVEATRAVLGDLGWPWTEETNPRTGATMFVIGSADLYDHLVELGAGGKSHEKALGPVVMAWPAPALEALLEGMMLGDGSPQRRNDRGQVNSSERLHTSSRCLADGVQAVASVLGRPTSIQTAPRRSGYPNAATEQMYTVCFRSQRRAVVGPENLRRVAYEGMVYCVTVPNGVVVVRRNGRVMACGNCWQAWALDPERRMYRYAEVHRAGRIVEDHARVIKEWQARTGDPDPIAIVCDHDAEGRATLERYFGRPTEPATKNVTAGIEAVASRLRGDARGPRLFFLYDSLIEPPDPERVEDRRPVCTEDEIPGYVWDPARGKILRDQPLKVDDDGADCTRYAAAYFDGADQETGMGEIDDAVAALFRGGSIYAG